MKAVSLNHVCNKCDDSIYAATESRVDDVNELLEQFDLHNAATITVQGNKTNRYVRLDLSGDTEEAIVAVQNVFMSAGYMTIVEQSANSCLLFVIFDADIAPGVEEDETVGAAGASNAVDLQAQEDSDPVEEAEAPEIVGAAEDGPVSEEEQTRNPSGSYDASPYGSMEV